MKLVRLAVATLALSSIVACSDVTAPDAPHSQPTRTLLDQGTLGTSNNAAPDQGTLGTSNYIAPDQGTLGTSNYVAPDQGTLGTSN